MENVIPKTTGGATPGHAQEGLRNVLLSTSARTAGFTTRVQELLAADGYAVILLDVESTDSIAALGPIAIDTVAGVLDATLTGMADALLGGAYPSESLLLDLAVKAGVPIVAVPGGLDMVTYGARAAIPAHLQRKKFYEASPTRTYRRTEVSEAARLGRLLAEKINLATGHAAVCIPLRGLSDLDAPGEPFSSAETNMALFGNLTTHLRRDIRLYDVNVNINDPAFAQLCVEALEVLIQRTRERSPI